MELPGAPPARTKRHWASQDAHHPRDPERHLLHPSRRLRLAAVAQRLSPLEDRLPLLPLLVPGWDVGEDARRSAQEGAAPIEEEPPAQCRDSGQPVGSQSVKTTGVGGKERGYDGAKRRSKEESVTYCVTYWWTPRGWCSKRGSTTPTS